LGGAFGLTNLPFDLGRVSGAYGLTNLPFDVGRISGEATPSDKNDELASNNTTYRVYVVEWLESAISGH
jgi:hypothetical protein